MWYCNEREFSQQRPEPGIASEACNTVGQQRRLRVLLAGQDGTSSSFQSVLMTNIQHWGYDAVKIPQELEKNSSMWREVAGDILLYDMDAPPPPFFLEKIQASDPSSATETGQGSRERPHVSLIIALSSSSISRLSLERLGAVALLHKPFDMRDLERYLRIFQRLFFAEEEIAREESVVGNIGPISAQLVRILVADDHQGVASVIHQCLLENTNQRYHYQVREAHDGLELLELCMSWKPQCVVTDLLMPWLNGYQVMQCLDAGFIRPDPTFIVISALMQHELPLDRSFLENRVVRYIDKPFEVEHLLASVEQALGQ